MIVSELQAKTPFPTQINNDGVVNPKFLFWWDHLFSIVGSVFGVSKRRIRCARMCGGSGVSGTSRCYGISICSVGATLFFWKQSFQALSCLRLDIHNTPELRQNKRVIRCGSNTAMFCHQSLLAQGERYPQRWFRFLSANHRWNAMGETRLATTTPPGQPRNRRNGRKKRAERAMEPVVVRQSSGFLREMRPPAWSLPPRRTDPRPAPARISLATRVFRPLRTVPGV